MSSTAEQVARRIEFTSGMVFDRETEVRTRLAEALTAGANITPDVFRQLAEAQAAANLWRQVNRGISQGHDAAKVIGDMRADITEQLLSGPRGASTCAFTNGVTAIEAQAAAEFLRNTAIFTI